MGFLHRRCDAHLEELKAEWAKERDILLAWIEQLQLQVGTLTAPRQTETQPPVDQSMALYIGEEEEQLLDAHASGLITDEQLEESMAQLQSLTKVTFG